MALLNGTRPLRLWWIDAAGIGVCLLVTAVGYVALVSPFLRKHSAAASLCGEVQTRQKKVTELESAVGAAQDRLAAAQQQLTAGAIELESAAHINKRIAGVTEFFSKCALHIDDVQTGRVSNHPQYDLVPITLVGRGAYSQCAKLLQGLCSKYPDMSVMRINLDGNPGADAETEKFRFELFWYAAPSGPTPKTVNGTTGNGPVTQS
jgi:Tfp pilus assembly protein PilO